MGIFRIGADIDMAVLKRIAHVPQICRCSMFTAESRESLALRRITSCLKSRCLLEPDTTLHIEKL